MPARAIPIENVPIWGDGVEPLMVAVHLPGNCNEIEVQHDLQLLSLLHEWQKHYLRLRHDYLIRCARARIHHIDHPPCA
jgi:hypothetical protein